MLELLSWLEASALGQTIRGSGVWTYGILNLVHIAGISTLFGSVLLLDLRLLGLWSGIPLGTIAHPTVPVAVIGFSLAVVSGICMLSVNATEYYQNPFLLIKFPAIALGVINVIVVSRMRAWREKNTRKSTSADRARLATAGGCSLACWSVALAAGRMIGYW